MSTIINSNSTPTIHDVMARIRALHINFIAIDFDQTLIDKHTGGVYTGSLQDIIPHVRPIFIELINAALQPPPPNSAATTTATTTNNDVIHVAIVTYSKQPSLIRSILEHVFGMDMASRIIIRGNDKSWKYEGNGMKDGKQAHMASAVEEILHNHQASQNGNTPTASCSTTDNNDSTNITASPATTTATTTTIPSSSTTTTLEITRNTSLLIDDDTRNITIALKNGTRAVWYNPKRVPQQLYIDLAQLI